MLDGDLGGVKLVYVVLELKLLGGGSVEVVHGVLELGGGGANDEIDDSVHGVVVEEETK